LIEEELQLVLVWLPQPQQFVAVVQFIIVFIAKRQQRQFIVIVFGVV
jgi:hypothetical protein